MSNEIIQTEDGGLINSTPERKNKALIVDSKIKDSVVDLWINISIMVDEELYRELGHSTAKEYFKKLDISSSLAYRYAFIGRGLREEKVKQIGSGSVHTYGHLGDIGSSKMEQIIRNAREELPRLIAEGKMEIDDDELSVDDLKKRSLKEMRRQLTALKTAEEESKEAKAALRLKEKENESLLKDVERLRRNQRNVELEEEKVHHLEMIGNHAEEMAYLMEAISIDESDSFKIKADLCLYLSMIDDRLRAARHKFRHIIEEMQSQGMS